MRICHINLAKGFSGGEQQTLNLIRELHARGIEQRLVCYPGGLLASRVAALGVPCVPVRHFIRGHARANGADLLHAHCGRGVYWAAIEHRLRGTPYLITRRVDNPLHQTITTRWAYHHAATVVCLSRAIARAVTDSVGPVTQAIIPSTYSRFAANTDIAAAIRATYPGKTLIGQVGKLLAHKGHDVTLAAARQLATTHPLLQFLILGDGPRRAELEAAARDLPNVTLLGHQRDIGNYLAALDLFVFPSLSEGLGSSILEAMQAGVPVIGADAGGIPDLIQDGETGLLVPPGDADALTHALLRLLNDSALAARLVSGARAALPRFSPQAMTDAYLALYHQLTSPKPSA